MRTNYFIKGAVVAFATISTLSSCCGGGSNDTSLGSGDIQHTVMFNLSHPAGSPEAKKFIQDGKEILSALPMVNNFAVYSQVSPKTDFDYHFTMVFKSQADYDAYNNHPNHQAFVAERWESEVTAFQEADFIKY